MPKKNLVRFLFLALFLAGLLYGSSYQQFRHFDIQNPKGGFDALSYLRMSHGDYNVSVVHRYRFVIPSLVSGIRSWIRLPELNSAETDMLAFYSVNFIFMYLTAILSFFVFDRLGFSFYMSLLGSVSFICSRMTAELTGMPLADSFYLFSVTSVILLTEYKKHAALCFSNPLFILSKETVIPFLLIPFFKKEIIKRKSMMIFLVFSLAVSLAVWVLSREYIDRAFCNSGGGHVGFVFNRIVHGWSAAIFQRLFTWGGLLDLTNGFSTLLVFSGFGFIVYKFGYVKKYKIPLYFDLTIIVAMGLALLSGNLGRMLFSAFIAIIAYALVGVEFILEYSGVTWDRR